MSQMLRFGLDPGTLEVERGNGNLGHWKSWKTVRVERSG